MCSGGLRILILIAGSTLLWFGYTGLKNRRVRVKGGHLIERAESPINYWLNVAVYFAAGLGGIGFGIFAPYFR